jgi:8-oxo-dGTP pyrophosphatase MutT (NUDIX family)
MDEEKNPWQILSEKKLYDNQWISLTEFGVINPNGGRGIYGKVHFKNTAVGILPLDSDLHTYIVGQFRFPLSKFSWEIPEGGSLGEEDPLICAKRELSEETGLAAAEWKPILHMHLSNSVSDEFAVIYLARQLSQGKSRPDETEKLRVKKLPFEEVFQMVEKGQITDSMSVAAILKVRLMLIGGII